MKLISINIATATKEKEGKVIIVALLEYNGHTKFLQSVIDTSYMPVAELKNVFQALDALKHPQISKITLITEDPIASYLNMPSLKDPVAGNDMDPMTQCAKALLNKIKQLAGFKIITYQQATHTQKSLLKEADFKARALLQQILDQHLKSLNFKDDPTPQTIQNYPTLEDFLSDHLSSPSYGTRYKIKDVNLIKAILEKIKNYTGYDTSHYDGYDPSMEKNAKKETITLGVNEYMDLEKNGIILDCNLHDQYFDGMRINIDRYSERNGQIIIHEFSILLDFYYPEEGYRKKCVKFHLLSDKYPLPRLCPPNIKKAAEKKDQPGPLQNKNSSSFGRPRQLKLIS
ncbi:MAG: hypothetical protein DRP08_02020 [Candidatus Aenigmatarchaeota archaeon]|nr:MAG: hypothetical protein DRP08_02020 [Candidatus Aenigmarchaeota archaeon]